MINWLPLLQARVGSACDGGIQLRETSTVDPLKKVVIAKFRDPIPGKAAWIAFQIIAHAFAAINDCVIQRIRKVHDKEYAIEILIKDMRRSTERDPFIHTWKSNAQKRKEEFHKYLRDKAEELKKEVRDEPNPTAQLPRDINLWDR